jgi:spore maturation protein CgeB
LRASTLEAVKALGVRMLHYTPDPYFSLWWKRTRTMDAAIGLFDVLVTSKQYEMAAYAEVGPQVIYVPLGFGLDAHRPMSPADAVPRAAFASDVGFLGGWEPRREQLLSAVAPHVPSLKIWGNAWDHLHDGRWTLRRYYRLKTNAGTAKFSIRRNAPIAAALQGNEVYAHEYAWALSGAKISVGFLRHVCPDQHTTRSFEIPACGSLMIADRTDEHREFFEEGKEAEFFSSTDELVDKVRFYVANDAARERMAKAGFERCHSAGYSYHHRVAEILRKCR